MKKNIIILDCSSLEVFKSFIHSDNFNPIFCIVFTQEQKQYCLDHNILAITLKEADFLDGIDYVDFNLINSYRATQRKVEFGMMRSLESNMIIANKYYNALGYFHHIFETHQIDCVFVHGIPHGYIPETILLDISSNKNIPTYHTYPVTETYSFISRYDKKYNLKVSIPINKKEVLAHLFDKIKPSFKKDILKSHIKNNFKYLIHQWGGGGALMLDILSCIKRRSLFITMGFYENIRITSKLYSYYRLLEMKRFYNKFAIKPDYSQKYLFYAIHFEPEAATGVIMDLQNQLSIIQILSHCIPKGWKLYLKDHPHQYNINNVLDHFYLTNISFFKDRGFYEEVLKLPNVELIDLNTPSKELLKNAQAIATINGSIILESIFYLKPCVTFDNKLMPITQNQIFSSVYPFENTMKLKKFLKNLDSMKLQPPQDEDYLELGKYYFDHSKIEAILPSILGDLEQK